MQNSEWTLWVQLEWNVSPVRLDKTFKGKGYLNCLDAGTIDRYFGKSFLSEIHKAVNKYLYTIPGGCGDISA